MVYFNKLYSIFFADSKLLSIDIIATHISFCYSFPVLYKNKEIDAIIFFKNLK